MTVAAACDGTRLSQRTADPLSATIAIVYFFHRLRLPTIVGFLLTGMVIGPNGLALIDSVAPVEILAEIGVALLLFTIGIEFSLEELRALPRRVIWAGLLQIGLTVAGTAVLAGFWGFPGRQAIFFGFLTALSSTAIVLRLYVERGEMHSLPGRAVSGVLFVQDLSIVPMCCRCAIASAEYLLSRLACCSTSKRCTRRRYRRCFSSALS